MQYFLLTTLLFLSLGGSAQPKELDSIVVVKTYENGSWNKWYFKEYSLVLVDAEDLNKWHIGMWGMELYIKTIEKNDWTNWEVEYMNTRCYLADGEHFNHWVFEGDGMKIDLIAEDKKLTTWTINTKNPVKMVMQGKDKYTWHLTGLDSGTGSASLDVLAVFVPLFSAVIRPANKLK